MRRDRWNWNAVILDVLLGFAIFFICGLLCFFGAMLLVWKLFGW